jgi:hypothetical protein
MRIVSGVLAIALGMAMMVQPRRMSRWASMWARADYWSLRRWLPFMREGSNDGYDPDDDPYWFLPPIVFGAFFVFIGIEILFFSN